MKFIERITESYISYLSQHKNLIPIHLVFGSPDCYAPKSDNHKRRVIIERRNLPTQTIFFPPEFDPTNGRENYFLNNDIALIRLPLPVVPKRENFINVICWRGATRYPYNDCNDVVVSMIRILFF